MKLHVYEMRHLPEEVRELFKSDMRIVVDYLAEGNAYRSDRKIRHKAALIKMLKVLSGEKVTDGDVEKWMKKCEIREEDEIKVCELFEQYRRQGKVEDILELLEKRGEIPRKLQEIIFAEKDMSVLKRWLNMASEVKSIEEFQNAMQ